MNAPLKSPAGTGAWTAARWTDRDIATAADIFKREIGERVGKGDDRARRGEAKRTLTLIAAELKRPYYSVANRYANYGATFDNTAANKHRAMRAAATAAPRPPRQPRLERWSSEEIQIAATMWQADVIDHYGDDEPPRGLKERIIHAIAQKLGRQFWSIEARLRLQGPSFGSAQPNTRAAQADKASPQQLIERDARAAARNAQSLTATMFGDPPPGFSALDRRKSP